jgi:8-hydroxy-5-deazaflavin:NADPH oxidoreductase
MPSRIRNPDYGFPGCERVAEKVRMPGMTTAIIGTGNIGSTVARRLAEGGETVVVAARERTHAEALAREIGAPVYAASVAEAIAQGDVVVFATWLDVTKELVRGHRRLLEGKIVVDPSNPIGFDESGQMFRTLPEGTSAASIIASLLPARAHYAKAFGTLGADVLAASANREPQRVVLLYATDDDEAPAAIEGLIRRAGFAPLKVGGVADAGRIEAPGGDLQGAILGLDEARAAVAIDVTA